MCCSTGLPATGAIGFVITPVSGKSLVPLPAARTIAFMCPTSLCLSCYVLRHLGLDQPRPRGGILDEERFGVYRIHHPNLGAGVVSPHDIHGSSDALGLGHHAETAGTAHLGQNPDHTTPFSRWSPDQS